MYSTFHLSSAQDLNNDILEAIKLAYQSKAITIIVEEDSDDEFELSSQMKTILDERLLEDHQQDLSVAESIENLKKKYNV